MIEKKSVFTFHRLVYREALEFNMKQTDQIKNIFHDITS